MAATDDAMQTLCESMRECGAGWEFDEALRNLIARYRRAHDARMLDAEAARLLPLGVAVVTARQGCHKSTVYRRVSRSKIVARLLRNAPTA